jgi:uncharacterized protein YcfJ
MQRGSLATIVLAAITATATAVPVAAEAQGAYYRPAPRDDGGRYVGYDRSDDRRAYYGRHYRCRSDGTGGAIVGAIAGGLLGNAIAGYGDRAAGTLLGGVGGALAGRAIDRDC